MPVVKIDGRTIGNGKPGKLTLEMLDRFRALRVSDGVRVNYDTAAAAER